MKRSWRNYRPTNLRDALRACKDYALERKQLSVERIADYMGESADSLYKWLSTGRMPANLVPTYELACGAHFVSDWLAASAGKLTIDIPRGTVLGAGDIQHLQTTIHSSIGALINFYDGKCTEEQTQAALMGGMAELAWHHANVGKFEQPELALS